LIRLHTRDVAGGRRGGEAYDGAVAAAYSAWVFELDLPRRVRQRQRVDFEAQAVEFKVRPGTRRDKGIGQTAVHVETSRLEKSHQSHIRSDVDQCTLPNVRPHEENVARVARAKSKPRSAHS